MKKLAFLTILSMGLAMFIADKVVSAPKCEIHGYESEHDIQKVNARLDFSDYPGGSVEQWLKLKGFVFEKDAKDRDSMGLTISGDGLFVEAKKPVRGFLFNACMGIEDYSKVKVEWGILRYPVGASYEKKIPNEALMVYFFFGYDRLPGGSLLIPDSPYFIALYLGKGDRVNWPYLGRYFHEGGRYVCLGSPRPGQTVVSEFDLTAAFKAYFKKDAVPPLSGICLGVDTSSSGNDGRTEAFIKRIEFTRNSDHR